MQLTPICKFMSAPNSPKAPKDATISTHQYIQFLCVEKKQKPFSFFLLPCNFRALTFRLSKLVIYLTLTSSTGESGVQHANRICRNLYLYCQSKVQYPLGNV